MKPYCCILQWCIMFSADTLRLIWVDWPQTVLACRHHGVIQIIYYFGIVTSQNDSLHPSLT